MSIQRLKIVLVHTYHHFWHSTETWVDIFWNPALQLWVYALIALSFATVGDARGIYIMIGMIFWNVIWVGEYAISVGALWEIWSQSFSSLFISPLTMEEFIVGQMISGTIKSILAVTMSAIIAFLLYRFSIFSLGWMIPVYYVELLVYSWSIGLLVLGLIFRYSTQVQSLSWALVFLVQPLGAIFYPVDILPISIRWIAYGLPATYIFEAMRKQVTTESIDWQMIGWATVVNLIWFIAAWVIFQRIYKIAKRDGSFARLEG